MSFKKYKVIRKKDKAIIQQGLCKSAATAVAIDLMIAYGGQFVVKPE